MSRWANLNQARAPSSGLRATWIGHSTVLLEIGAFHPARGIATPSQPGELPWPPD